MSDDYRQRDWVTSPHSFKNPGFVKKLILFDVDGTLVFTGGAGGRAMTRALAEVVGSGGLDALSTAGRTDFWIVEQIARSHGVDLDSRRLARLRAAYVSYLAEEIEKPGGLKGLMPGVRALLDELHGRDDTCVALLTGNFEAGARIKLEYFDVWRYFVCGAFGDGTRERNELLSVALARVEACGVRTPCLSDVIIVGDTPLDVAVAASGGARSLAVATGDYSVETLRACGADEILPALTDLPSVLRAFGMESEMTEGVTGEEANGARWPSRSSKSVAPR